MPEDTCLVCGAHELHVHDFTTTKEVTMGTVPQPPVKGPIKYPKGMQPKSKTMKGTKPTTPKNQGVI